MRGRAGVSLPKTEGRSVIYMYVRLVYKDSFGFQWSERAVMFRKEDIAEWDKDRR